MRTNKFVAGLGAVAMLAGVSTAAIAAEFRADLAAENELTPGDTDGWGRVKIHVDDTLNTLCADVEVRGLGKVSSVRIYRGAAGENGQPVVSLDPPKDDDADDCDTIGDTLADDIQSNPSNFYISVVTDEFPNGAIRGQLMPGSKRAS